MKNKIKIICLNCGNNFEIKPYRKNIAKFCSKKCYGIFISKEKNPYWMGKKIEKTCLICNKNFEVFPSFNRIKCCSRNCANIYRSINNRGEKSTNWKGKIKMICNNCNKEFEIYPYQKNITKFCSSKCMGLYYSKNNSNENSPCWKGRIKIICENCNKEFNVQPYRKNIAKFCSSKCMGLYYSKNNCGENGHNWQGGKSFEPYCEKWTEELREKIREQYNRKCVICGKDEKDNITHTGKVWKLSVHHIDGDKEQGCNGKPWKLMPTCLHCHNSRRMCEIK